MSKWITPVTNRTSGNARMTYKDMNRITGNIDYVYQALKSLGYPPAGNTVSKLEWTQNDIIDVDFWESMLSVMAAIYAALGETGPYELTNDMGWENINHVESWLFELYDGTMFYRHLLNEHGVDICDENGEPILVGDMVYAGLLNELSNNIQNQKSVDLIATE